MKSLLTLDGRQLLVFLALGAAQVLQAVQQPCGPCTSRAEERVRFWNHELSAPALEDLVCDFLPDKGRKHHLARLLLDDLLSVFDQRGRDPKRMHIGDVHIGCSVPRP